MEKNESHTIKRKYKGEFPGDIVLKDTCKSPDYTSVTIKSNRHVVVKREYVFDSVEEAIKNIKHDTLIEYMKAFNASPDDSSIATLFPPNQNKEFRSYCEKD